MTGIGKTGCGARVSVQYLRAIAIDFEISPDGAGGVFKAKRGLVARAFQLDEDPFTLCQQHLLKAAQRRWGLDANELLFFYFLAETCDD